MTKKRMFLIDAMAMAFRNYHAFGVRPLTTPQGLPISAVFGSATYILKLIKEEKPDYLAVLSDTKTKTFRHEMYPLYKANRTDMPEDLSKQIPYFYKLFEHLQIPTFYREGYEADDLIGTIASRYANDDLDVYIVSGDKDFMQLVNKNVFLYRPMKGGESEIIDELGVKEKFGVRPDQVIDALALMGDSADNIPGVSGIGEKGAAKLLEKYMSLDQIYERFDDLPANKQKEALRLGKDQAYLAKKLLTIHTDAPLPFQSLEELRFNPSQCFGGPALLDFFESMAFRRLKDQVLEMRNLFKVSEEDVEAQSAAMFKGARPYLTITSLSAIDQVIKDIRAEGRFAFDTETTGLSLVADTPIGISLAWGKEKAAYIPLHPSHTPLGEEQILTKMREIFEDSKLLKIAHNAKFDIGMLMNKGLRVSGPVHDTYLMAYLIEPTHKGHGLDEVSLKHLQIKKIPTSALIGKHAAASMLEVPMERLSEYACEDADCTWQIYPILKKELETLELMQIATNIEFPLIPVLTRMEQAGVYIDIEQLQNLSRKLTEDLIILEQGIHQEAGEPFNINSPKQLQYILFEKLKIHEALNIRTIKKTKSGYSTDVSVLERLAEHPLPKKILEFRTLAKLKNTYIDVLPTLIDSKTKRIHTHFNQTGTSTGRLSSTDPNLQNIPIRSPVGKMIRSAFCVQNPESVMISADYSQIELRLLAHMANESHLIEAFKQGADIHTATAAKIFGVEESAVDGNMRAKAKAINFGIIYGMGASRLSREINVSFSQAKAFIEKYFSSYPRIREFAEQCKEQVRNLGYTRTLTGRRRPVPEAQSDNPAVAASADNIAVNAPIQGTAADLIKLAMIKIDEALQKKPLKAKMLLQVHDELVFECHNSDCEELKALIEKNMAGAMELSVPLKVEIGTGQNWLDAH